MVRALVSILAFAVIIASCSSAPSSLPAGSTARTTAAPTGTGAASAPANVSSPPATAAASGPAASAPYLRTELIDVRTNERFTLASLAGKVVIVEGMAVW
jgi:hypothetical protein